MPSRPPRLPMFLGLAVLTAMANLLLLAFHALLHIGLAVPIRSYDALVLGLVGLGPVVGVALILQRRPRHGAAVLATLMLLSLGTGLWSHYAADGPDLALRAQDDVWGQLFAGTAFMQVAFALQGFAVATILLFRPEVPRPRYPEMPAS